MALASLRLALIVAALLAFSASGVNAAVLVNAPDPRLDAVSSEVAGRPVTVHCETDAATWAALTSWKTGAPADGFASLQTSTNFLSPRACLNIRAALQDPTSIGTYDIGTALRTLLHEAVHQRGGIYSCALSRDPNCEGLVDCTALTLVRRYAISFLGIPEYETVSWTEHRIKRVRVKIKGKWVIRKRRVAIQKSDLIPNSLLVEVVATAKVAHASANAPYNLDCSSIAP